MHCKPSGTSVNLKNIHSYSPFILDLVDSGDPSEYTPMTANPTKLMDVFIASQGHISY